VSRRALLALAAGALAALGACATAARLRETSAVVRGDVEKARKSGAQRCAPKELAVAEANLEFADEEVASGNASRAAEHLSAADRAVKEALRLSRTCGPTQVIVRKVDPPRVVIAKTDRDGDGVPDLEDACPDTPGLPQFKGCPDSDGDGIPDNEDDCPLQAGPKETRGCPVAKDTDGDGLPDDIDRCPLDPEDKDGFQDEDGCPDPDNDGDGIVDKADACPNDPGPLENRGCPIVDVDGDGDGIPDRLDRCPNQFGPAPDGCPKKYALVDVSKDRIQIKQQVKFAPSKFKVLPASFKLLNQVAQAMTDFPKIRVSIEGHTDNVGSESANVKLSQRRAEAVRDYLVAKGVSPSRLQAIGYGPTKPIASNKTTKGKAQNRRTEFRIVSLD
jgi:outer membrane protein OmpA-like peptidoglycan-associated protein